LEQYIRKFLSERPKILILYSVDYYFQYSCTRNWAASFYVADGNF